MRIATTTLILLAVGLLLDAPAHATENQLVTQNSLDALIERYPMFSGGIIVAQDGEITAHAYVGMSDKPSNESNHAETLFSVASAGKMFTAVAITQLAESGELAFRTAVVEIIPELANRISGEVSIDDLLQHTSGIERISGLDDGTLDALQSNNDHFKLILARGVGSDGPTEFAYRNENFVLLGEVVERVAHKPFEVYIRERIADPINMVGPIYTRRDRAHSLPIAQPYLAVDYQTWWNSEDPIVAERVEEFVHVPPPPPPTPSAGGGPYARAFDLFLFATALREGALISSSSFAEMCSSDQIDEPGGRGYARGCQVLVSENGLRIGHTGSTAGVQARFYLYMRQNVDVVVLSNHDAQAAPIFGEIEELVHAVTSSKTP